MKIQIQPLILLMLSSLSISFGYAQDANKLQAVEILNTTQSWDNTELSDAQNSVNQITALKVIIPPNSSTAVHLHPVLSVGYVIKGELTLISEDKELKITEGEALVELVGKWHKGVNKTNSPVELFVIYINANDNPLTIYQDTKKPH